LYLLQLELVRQLQLVLVVGNVSQQCENTAVRLFVCINYYPSLDVNIHSYEKRFFATNKLSVNAVVYLVFWFVHFTVYVT